MISGMQKARLPTCPKQPWRRGVRSPCTGRQYVWLVMHAPQCFAAVWHTSLTVGKGRATRCCVGLPKLQEDLRLGPGADEASLRKMTVLSSTRHSTCKLQHPKPSPLQDQACCWFGRQYHMVLSNGDLEGARHNLPYHLPDVIQ